MKDGSLCAPLSSSTVTSPPTVNDGSSFTGSTVIDTVADGDATSSEVAVKPKLSVPLKSRSGVYVQACVHVFGVWPSHSTVPVSDSDPWLGVPGVNATTAAPDASIASSENCVGLSSTVLIDPVCASGMLAITPAGSSPASESATIAAISVRRTYARSLSARKGHA